MQRKPYQRESETQRKAALIEATLDCVARLGVRGVTVRAIAASAEVTQGLIRHYFSSKDELVRQAYRLHMREMADVVAVPRELDGAARLAHLVHASLSPPVATPRSVAIWANFVALVPCDAAIAKIHRQEYVAFRDMIESALDDAMQPAGRRISAAQRAGYAIALNALIDGLWLEAGLAPELFRKGELAAIGLEQAGRVLGIDLAAALKAAA